MFYPPNGKIMKKKIQQLPKSQKKPQTVVDPQQQVSLLLEIPSQQRSNHNHQLIWNFFHQFSFFKDVQNSKSIYAMIMCLSMLRKEIKSQQSIKHPFQYCFKNKELAILHSKDYEEIINRDQSQIRKRVERLNMYQSLASLNYEQMLYIAHHVEQKQFKYKEYVYRMNEEPSHIYFVEEGQFHYVLQTRQQVNHHQEKISKTERNPRKRIINKPYIQIQESHNRNHQYKNIIKKIAIVTGKLGLSMGQEELTLNTKRKYSLVCLSTTNFTFALKKIYFLCLLQGNDNIRNQMTERAYKKLQMKSEIQKKNEKTRIHIDHYVEQIVKNVNLNLKQKDKDKDKRVNEQLLKNQGQLNKNKFYSNILVHSRSKTFEPLVNKVQKKQKKQNQLIQQSEEIQQFHQQDGGFSLTQIQNSKSLTKKPESNHEQINQNHQKQINYNVDVSKIRELIKSRELMKSQELNKSSSLSKSRQITPATLPPIIVSSRTQLNQSNINVQKENHHIFAKPSYSGMIDSEALVKQKEHILSLKSRRPQRLDLFPKQDRQMTKNQLQKAIIRASCSNKYQLPMIAVKQTRKVSPAHSKFYMQRLLLNVLQKSGYDLKDEENQSKDNNKVPKKSKKPKLKIIESPKIFEDNSEFHNCFFKNL